MSKIPYRLGYILRAVVLAFFDSINIWIIDTCMSILLYGQYLLSGETE